MCYRVYTLREVDVERVGVRAFRENLSLFLKRARDGETLEVTEHGRPIARLTPIPGIEDPLDRLIAEGRARPPRATIDDVLPARGEPDPQLSRALRRALDEQREDKI